MKRNCKSELPGCELLEWELHKKEILEDWDGGADDLELKLHNEWDTWFGEGF